MSVLHRTTLTPTKLELITGWLPAQPWYRGDGRAPRPQRVGGFRLDDPDGAVGIEFLLLTDAAGDGPRTYQVPLTYRHAPLADAGHALLGTAEHGVLGTRWVYDGARDPLLISRLFALLAGETTAQSARTSHTPEPAVTARIAETGHGPRIRCAGAHDVPDGTAVLVESPGPTPRLILRVNRELPAESGSPLGEITGEWQRPDGSTARGALAVVHDAATAPLGAD